MADVLAVRDEYRAQQWETVQYVYFAFFIFSLKMVLSRGMVACAIGGHQRSLVRW